MRSALLSLLALALCASLCNPAAAEESSFGGNWDGSIALGGMSLGIRVHLAAEGGAWTGSIDIPMQGARDLPLDGIAVAGDSITFAIAGVPGDPSFEGALAGDSIAGSFAQNGRIFPFELVRGGDVAPRRPQDPLPPFPYSSEDVTIDTGEVTLAGTMTLPLGIGPFPGVVLLTGSGPQNRDEELFDHRPFLVLADYLSRRGIAVLRCDDRGVGGSTGSLSEATSADFARDALAAVERLARDDHVDGDRIGLLGHSEGAMIAPVAAGESEAVAFIVMLAGPGVPIAELLALQSEQVARAQGQDEETATRLGALNRELTALIMSDADAEDLRAGIRDNILRQIDLSPQGERPGGEVLDNMIEGNIQRVSSPWFQDFIRFDPRVNLRRVTVPVLALNGELDTQVVYSQNLPAIETALAAAGNSDVTTRSLPGLNHLFQHASTGGIAEYGEIDETISPEVLEIIHAWIAERFGTD